MPRRNATTRDGGRWSSLSSRLEGRHVRRPHKLAAAIGQHRKGKGKRK